MEKEQQYTLLECTRPRTLQIDCDTITLKDKSVDLTINIPTEKIEQFDYLILNGIQFSNLSSIKDVNFKEALECLQKLGTRRIEYREGFELGFTKTMPFKSTREFKIIEHALFKPQENEKDKVFLKNIGNTKVRVPLVDIFRGLPQEKRFAYTEHIYYHWEEMKESLEAEIEHIKDEKEKVESKAKEQKKILNILFEKTVDLGAVKYAKTYKEYNNRLLDLRPSLTTSIYFLTEEEFNLLKRYYYER